MIELSPSTISTNQRSGNVVTSNSMDDQVTQYPQAIQTYINENYSGHLILQITLLNENESTQPANTQYIVSLSSGDVLYFDEEGDFLTEADDDNDPQQIPNAIIAYLNEHYPDAIVDEIKQKSNGQYEVRLEDNTKLYFDENGQFLYQHDEDDGNNSDGGNIDPNQLPQDILQYIAENYPSEQIDHAEHEPNGHYEVELDNGTQLFFDENGTLMYQEESGGEWWEHDHDQNENDLPYNLLPQNIINYIQQNYPQQDIVKAELEPSGNYEIRLDGCRKLYFNSYGVFLYEENEFSLEISNFTLPDTVSMGQIITMSGFVVNRGIEPFIGNDLSLVFGIEDQMPTNLQNVPEDGNNVFNNIFIAPGDSIPFEIPVEINTANFNVGLDIAVIWPEVPTAINPILINDGPSFKYLVVEP